MPVETFNEDTNPMLSGPAISLLADPRGPRPPGEGLPVVPMTPIQVCGAVEMGPCTPTECRVDDECCYLHPVLAEDNNSTDPDPYKNDANHFLLDFPTWNGGNVSCTFYVDKNVNGAWVQQTAISDNSYGTWHNFNTWPDHPTYTSYLVQWNLILNAFGAGTYRIRAVWGITGGASQVCWSSEPFCLMEWSCVHSNRTVKLEAENTKQIGSIDTDGYVFDLCGMVFYDAIRFKGKFGYEVTDYEEKSIKYQDGFVKVTRMEALQNFTLKSGFLPKNLHDRIKVYFHMADELRISDYNRLNSDWKLNRKRVKRNSGYKPEYKEHARKSKVTCEYVERIQNVIKSICCDDKFVV